MASVFDAVAAINAQLIAQVPGLVAHVGAEWLVRNEVPIRVVWVPTSDTYQPGKRAFGKFWTGQPGEGEVLPRSIGTVFVGFEVHIWGAAAQGDTSEFADLAGTLALRDQLFLAMRTVGFGSISSKNGRWPDTEGGQTLAKGRLYVLNLELDAPVAPADGLKFKTVDQAQGQMQDQDLQTGIVDNGPDIIVT